MMRALLVMSTWKVSRLRLLMPSITLPGSRSNANTRSSSASHHDRASLSELLCLQFLPGSNYSPRTMSITLRLNTCPKPKALSQGRGCTNPSSMFQYSPESSFLHIVCQGCCAPQPHVVVKACQAVMARCSPVPCSVCDCPLTCDSVHLDEHLQPALAGRLVQIGQVCVGQHRRDQQHRVRAARARLPGGTSACSFCKSASGYMVEPAPV